MKKSLLSLIAGLAIVLSASAQKYWEANYPYAASGYTEWAAVADSFQVTLSADSAWKTTQLQSLINTTTANNWSIGWGARYAVAISGTELNVTFSPDKDEWSSFNINFYDWIQGDAPAATAKSFNGTTGKVGGYYVDFQPTNDGMDNGIIKGMIYIPSALKVIYADQKFPIRVSVFDAHGHEWNAGGDAIDTIGVDFYDTWTEFSINYDDIRDGWGGFDANPGDGWGEKFHGITRPIANNTVRAAVDFTKIVGLRFYLCPGKNHSDNTLNGTVVKIKDITVGTSADGSGIHNFTPLVPPVNTSVSEVSSDSPVVSVEVINLLGQTVATVSSIADVTVDGIAILKVTKEDGSVEVVKIAK